MKLGRDVVIISKAILDQPGQPALFSHKTLDSNQINLSDYSNFRYFKTSLTVLLSQSSSLILNSRNWATMSSSPILECYFWTVKYFIRQFRSPFSSFIFFLPWQIKSIKHIVTAARVPLEPFLLLLFCCLFSWHTFPLTNFSSFLFFLLPKNLFPFSVNHTSCSRLSENQQLVAITTREKIDHQ